MKVTSNSRILIATFSPWKKGKRLPINGNLEPMIDYFTKKVDLTVLIDQVYPGSDFVMPRIEIHKKGKKLKIVKNSLILKVLTPILRISNTDATHTIFKIRDFLSVIMTSFAFNKPFDIFIGFESINAFSGILLRKLGKIRTVIYYVSDYSPTRYSNSLFNKVYLWLDRFCVRNADYVWDVSKAIHPARVKVGFKGKKHAPILHVPNALYESQIKFEKPDNLEGNSLVFMGTLGKENGPDLAIEALSLVKEKIPDVTLHIVGGGREEDLKKLAIKNNVINSIIFHGFISDRNEVSKKIRKYMIGLAPYIYMKGSARLYGDATKIRAYTAAGLPVITTQVPPLGSDIEKMGAGIIAKDNKKDFSTAIIKVLDNEKLYLKLRNGAIEFAKNNTWDNVFNKAFSEMKENAKNN